MTVIVFLSLQLVVDDLAYKLVRRRSQLFDEQPHGAVAKHLQHPCQQARSRAQIKQARKDDWRNLAH